MEEEREVIIYTDGGASGNPGKGGYGAILMYGRHKKELSGAFRVTTNNRMELLAVITSLEAITKPDQLVCIVSDSKYVVDAVQKGWVFNWERVKFKKKKNPDLWRRFLEVYRKHRVRFVWVKGHDGNAMNERADVLAVSAYQNGPLHIDEGYESGLASGEDDGMF
ncbi:MAG: ribonuclease HI [Flavobacteriales bacterium]|jgi:ribonuclease HI|nr:ribonuclease HI [Flavobacteriales bacterium]